MVRRSETRRQRGSPKVPEASIRPARIKKGQAIQLGGFAVWLPDGVRFGDVIIASPPGCRPVFIREPIPDLACQDAQSWP